MAAAASPVASVPSSLAHQCPSTPPTVHHHLFLRGKPDHIQSRLSVALGFGTYLQPLLTRSLGTGPILGPAGSPPSDSHLRSLCSNTPASPFPSSPRRLQSSPRLPSVTVLWRPCPLLNSPQIHCCSGSTTVLFIALSPIRIGTH